MPATYLKTTAESSNPRLQAFCGTFGSPIYSTSPGESVQPLYVLRVGILCQHDRFVPRRQIGWRSARPLGHADGQRAARRARQATYH